MSTDPFADLAGSWRLDADRSTVVVRTKAMRVLPVKAELRPLHGGGTVTADKQISGELVIDAASFSSGIGARDKHIRSADFLDVENHPHLRYEVTGMHADGGLVVDGRLTAHGTTADLAVPVTTDVGPDTVTVHARVELDRKDWGITTTRFGAALATLVEVDAVFVRP